MATSNIILEGCQGMKKTSVVFGRFNYLNGKAVFQNYVFGVEGNLYFDLKQEQIKQNLLNKRTNTIWHAN